MGMLVARRCLGDSGITGESERTGACVSVFYSLRTVEREPLTFGLKAAQGQSPGAHRLLWILSIPTLMYLRKDGVRSGCEKDSAFFRTSFC